MKTFFLLHPFSELRETKDLSTTLRVASVCSARNNGHGFGITLTDYQISLLIHLLDEYIKENNL